MHFRVRTRREERREAHREVEAAAVEHPGADSSAATSAALEAPDARSAPALRAARVETARARLRSLA